MDKEKMARVENIELFIHKEEGNFVICRKIDEVGAHNVKQIKQLINQVSHAFSKT
jgi:hypothetical protein